MSAAQQEYRARLLSMGIATGTYLMVMNIAPFGDPLLIRVGDMLITLRRDEADALDLERVYGDPDWYGIHIAPPRIGHRSHGMRGRRRADFGSGPAYHP